MVPAVLTDWCQERNIQITAYSSFGPMSYREMDMAHDVPLLFENPTITSIAKKHNKEPSQILLRWATQYKIAVIPKSNNPNRLAQNLDVCSFDLPKEDLEAIDALDKHLRFNDPLAVSLHLFSSAKLHWNVLGILIILYIPCYTVRHPCSHLRLDSGIEQVQQTHLSIS
jgi:diketogulonate reductase-like aldo/keto reductase